MRTGSRTGEQAHREGRRVLAKTTDLPAIEALLREREIPLESLAAPLDLETLFGRTAPLAIEIGTGNGYFLENESGRLADWNLIGIEHEPRFYYKMAKRCIRAGRLHVRTWRGDAFELLEKGIPDHSVARVYSYFSDPWPKRRHADRRIAGERLVPSLERVLAPDGEFWFKTDMAYYFNLAVTVFRRRGGWRLIEVRRMPPPDPAKGEILSNYERKARETDTEVWGFKAIHEG